MHKGLDGTMPVRAAVTGRRSVRGFLPEPVPDAVLRQVLEDAARAPSATNSQPWFVSVVTGAARDRLSKAVIAAAVASETSQEYDYEPQKWWEPYVTRRRKIGFDLYGLVGVKRDDMAARQRQALKNFEYFGAPVGLFFFTERAQKLGAFLDTSLYMQNVMVLARAHGLETCPQAAWLHYGQTVRRELGIGEELMLISGMSLGYEDKAAPANRLTTERASLDTFVRFHNE